jgi:hypothetical protein
MKGLYEYFNIQAVSTAELCLTFPRALFVRFACDAISHPMADSPPYPGRKSGGKASRGNGKLTKKLTPLEGTAVTRNPLCPSKSTDIKYLRYDRYPIQPALKLVGNNKIYPGK